MTEPNPSADKAETAPTAKQSGKLSMFESARFKLTLFYLGIILILSLTLTMGTRMLAQSEYERSNTAQRGAFQGVITRMYGPPVIVSDDVFGFQQQAQQAVSARLDLYLELINLCALVFGGVASWWFAGRTLRPIEEAHNAQKRFASDASHELRTPLTTLRLENEVFLRQRSFNEPEARELIQSNLEEVNRLEKLATNLLALTQYESANLNLRTVKVKDLVTEAIAQTKRNYPNAKIGQKLQNGVIVGNQESLVQLLVILLDNACKYGQGSPITVRGKKAKSNYTIEVQDKGPGIADVDLPHIFERLYRSDKARSQTINGHGLGLSLAQQIASANDATLTATNNPKRGAIFSLTLPIQN